MGTSIDCLFARGIDQDPEAVLQTLTSLFSTLTPELDQIRELGSFSQHSGAWSIAKNDLQDSEFPVLHGEGPSGFGVDVYERVICLGSVERFFSIQRADVLGLALRHVFEAAAQHCGTGSTMAVAAGGFGDTDHAIDLACYQGASFDDLTISLQQRLGTPARSWEELRKGDHTWYLGPRPTESTAIRS